jgi:addiction module HigA family antidote
MASTQQRIEQLNTMSRRPSTPGEVVGALIGENGITQSELARRLGVSRRSVNELVQGRRAISADMAHRLGRVLGNGPGLWLSLQQQVDMWDALHMDQTAYHSLRPLEPALVA